MSAEILRRAAALMRERAENSLPGPWRVECDEDSGESYVVGERDIASVHEWSAGLGNPEHIASWHPDVALAVADLLDAVADLESSWDTAHPESQRTVRALAVARKYLGEASC